MPAVQLRIHTQTEAPSPVPRTGKKNGPRDIFIMKMGYHRYRTYRRRLVERDGKCVYCGANVDGENSTLDHQIPVCQGGQEVPWNLWLCCYHCNQTKAGRTAIQWLEDLCDACIRMGLLPECVDEG